jgi:hypothetical protein
MSKPFTGGLVWGVKKSFRDYIGSTPDGRAAVDAGASVTRNGTYFFVQLDGLRFGGALVFSAHEGALHLEFADPWIERGDDSEARLTVLTGAADGVRARVCVALLDLGEPEVSHGSLWWRGVPARLSGEGATLFDHTYAPGTPLEPVTVRIAPNTLVDEGPLPS